MTRNKHPWGRVYPTVLDAAIADLEAVAEAEGQPAPHWLTLTPYCQHVGSRRQTLINRLLAWYDHCQRRSATPWSDPVACPIYRHGRLPRQPRRGCRPGCWLLDANREVEIWRRLRDFGHLTPTEYVRFRQRVAGSEAGGHP